MYLVFGEEGIADAGHQHQGDQQRDEGLDSHADDEPSPRSAGKMGWAWLKERSS
jgi:hypothetical protein